MTGPDFLGIGMSRAGTTYLYRYLREHPQVWLPPIKELHFFDRHKYGWPTGDGRSLTNRLRFLAAVLRRWDGSWKGKADRHFAFSYARGNLDSVSTYRRHFGAARRGNSRGEITPDYYELDSQHVEEIRRAFPHLRIFLTIRHPLERFESQVRKYLEQSDDPDPLAAATGWVDRPGFVKSFDYLDIVERWRNVFGSDDFHIAYFDELETDPEGYLNRICGFIGVERWIPAGIDLRNPVNSSRRVGSHDLPGELLEKFARKVMPLVENFCGREPGVPAGWYRDVERAAGER